MTTPPLAGSLSAPIPSPVKKKRVLLVDTSPNQRALRAETMRKLGMEVDCAADIGEARSWWRANLYNLVLINVENDAGPRDEFCGDIRSATPPQQLAFLVGKPEYLANSPHADRGSAGQVSDDETVFGDVQPAFSADLRDLPQRWGILEASRRISAVRSASNARTKAMRERPAPPRDLEARHLERMVAECRNLDDLLREEMS